MLVSLYIYIVIWIWIYFDISHLRFSGPNGQAEYILKYVSIYIPNEREQRLISKFRNTATLQHEWIKEWIKESKYIHLHVFVYEWKIL